MNDSFRIDHDTETVQSNENFFLHNHMGCHEILLFLDGDSEFHAEGSIYSLQPYDIVIASGNEMHRIAHLSCHRYDRYVIMIDREFFQKNGCAAYANVFEDRPLGLGNRIGAEIVKEYGLHQLMEKIHRYDQAGESLIANAVLLELLYLLNQACHATNTPPEKPKQIQSIIQYIDENLQGDLSVGAIADHFYISRAQLYRIFKMHMRMTVKEYITYKRLLLARQLSREGKTLLEASSEAGFSNYSSFYRMYLKEFYYSPSQGMK